MAKGTSDLGTKLHSAVITGDVIPSSGFKKLVGVRSVPATGSAPEQFENTEMDEVSKSNIEGRKDTPEMSFAVNHTAENFTALTALQGKRTAFLIEYPSGLGTLIVGTASVFHNGGATNSLLEMTLTITAESVEDIDVAQVTGLVAVA